MEPAACFGSFLFPPICGSLFAETAPDLRVHVPASQAGEAHSFQESCGRADCDVAEPRLLPPGEVGAAGAWDTLWAPVDA